MELTLKNDKGHILTLQGKNSLELLDLLTSHFRFSKKGVSFDHQGGDVHRHYSAKELQSFENLTIEIK